MRGGLAGARSPPDDGDGERRGQSVPRGKTSQVRRIASPWLLGRSHIPPRPPNAAISLPAATPPASSAPMAGPPFFTR